MKNYIKYHVHSDLSNPTTILDSVTKFEQYIDKAKELNMKAIGFSEHGNVFSWVNKKKYCEKNGLKYIHGIEMYVTETLDKEKLSVVQDKIIYAKIKKDKSITFNSKDIIEDVNNLYVVEFGKSKKEIESKLEHHQTIIEKVYYNQEKDIYFVNDLDFSGTVAVQTKVKENKKIRDNYHVILLAKNYDGVKEINKLSSLSFNRAEVKVVDDVERYYYNPRITFDELKNTSDNVVVITACLGGILNSKREQLEQDFIKFLASNNHRCFLEIQHHYKTDEQKIYNQRMLQLSNEHDIKLIAGTDTHCLDNRHRKAREIMQKAKNSFYPDEDNWDVVFKTYDELVECYKRQNAFSENVYMDAIENTNLLYDLIEDFEFDTKPKYPQLYKNPEDVLREKITIGAKKRNVDLNDERYANRIETEIDIIKKQDALNFFLLEDMVKAYAKQEDIAMGYSRGSASGSLLLYLLSATEIDSIKYELDFERFMSAERISLADVDSDYHPDRRIDIKRFIHSIETLNCSEIITFNTVQTKGSIRDIGRALEIPLEEINSICANLPNDEDEVDKYLQNIKVDYPELIEYLDIIVSVITSIGSHPAGTIVYDHSLQELIGTATISTCEFPISQINMKEVDFLNLVKLDILGLENVKVIEEACKLANIPYLNPDNIQYTDENVWKSINESGVGVFQFASGFAHQYLCEVFSDDTIERMKKDDPNIDYLYLASVATGAIRPAGASYRDKISHGIFTKHGHKALDDFLSKTRGQLVFQETIMKFLNQFCGYSMGQADVVRRKFSKKLGTEDEIPAIKKAFIETMQDKYGTSQKEAEDLIDRFLTVIEDASDYLFSLLHALPYTMITYATLYLRYYHKLEFLTALLNSEKSNKEETKRIVDYASENNISISNPKFRYSKSDYFPNKETNSIYKGVSSIKGLGSDIADYLYSIREIQFDSFVDFLVYIAENYTTSTKIRDLIILDFFEEFGNNQKLLSIFDAFKDGEFKYDKKHSDKTKQSRIEGLKEFEKNVPNNKISIKEQINYEVELLGYIQSKYNTIKRYGYVLDIDTRYTPKINVQFLYSGKTKILKINKNRFAIDEIKIGDLIHCKIFEEKPKTKLRDGGNPKEKKDWIKDWENKEWWCTEYTILDDIPING